MTKKVLVIGATGLIGQAVAKQLNTDGYMVKVLSRSLEKAQNIFKNEFEIFEGDVYKEETLNEAFKDVDCVFISLPEKDVPAAIDTILEKSKNAGIDQLGYVSGCTVKKENAWHPMINGHYQGESKIKASSLNYTIFRLTMVLDMVPRYANNGKAFIIGKQNHKWSWIYSGDVAKMVSTAFRNEKAKNQSFTIFGPDKYTIPEAVDIFNKEFFPAAKKASPKPYWMANLLALFAGSTMKYAISIFKYFEDHPEEGDPAIANEILGKPTTGLKQFFEIYKNNLS